MAPALDHAIHHVHHPCSTFSARSALSARFVFVELEEHVSMILLDDEHTHMSKTSDSRDQVSALVHNDDSPSSETRLRILEGIEVHPVGFLALIYGKTSNNLTRLLRIWAWAEWAPTILPE
jgi:hypothetical protein